MIEFKQVYIKYINQFYSLYNFNATFSSHTLLVNDTINSGSAIMRILAKIDNNYTGNVFIDKINLKNIKDKDLNIAYLPEKPELFKNKNIIKNLIYPLIIRKINKNTAKNTANELIFKYNLQNFIKNMEKIKIKKLNISEQKIIALLRAIIRKPKILLIENFFKDLDKEYIPLANEIITDASKHSLIIASEQNSNLNCYKDFEIYSFEK